MATTHLLAFMLAEHIPLLAFMPTAKFDAYHLFRFYASVFGFYAFTWLLSLGGVLVDIGCGQL